MPCTSFRILSIKMTAHSKYRQGCGRTGTLSCWWEYKIAQPLWKTVWLFLKELIIDVSCDPTIPFQVFIQEK